MVHKYFPTRFGEFDEKFYERYEGHGEKVQRSVALLPWSHNMLLLSKGLDDDATAYYANEVFRSGYNLGFLGVTTPILELELEDRLVKTITRFLMELGNGFTFIGNQHVLEYNGKESKVDMLFFHRSLRCSYCC